MNATSTLASETGSGRLVAVRLRAFVRSIETTRESRRSGSASWPRPTSTAYTRRAPRWSRTSVKPPVDAPDVEAAPARRVDAERIERRRELVAAPAHVRLRRGDLDRDLGIDEVARLPIESRPIARPDAHLAAEQQRLGTGARFGKAPVRDELIEPNPRHAYARHRLMVAHAASPRLTRTGPDRRARATPSGSLGASGRRSRP